MFSYSLIQKKISPNLIEKKNRKAAPDKSQILLTRVKVLGHIIKGTTITPLKSQIDEIL